MRADLEAYRLMCAGNPAAALGFAERAVAGVRTLLPAHGMLATILLKLGRAAEAEQAVESALLCEPGSADAYDALAHVSMLLGAHERSNRLYRRVTELAPDSARTWYNFASSERSFGRLDSAESACDRAIALDPAHYPSFLLRSQLKVQTSASNHVEALERLLAARAGDDRARMFLGYALGKELDDLDRFDEAFRWFDEAARTRRRHLAYEVALDERKLQRIREVFTGAAVRAPSAPPAPDTRRYVFVVGLPRSGTTLVERIVSGLPGVRSNGETSHFADALFAAAPGNEERSASADIFERAACADPARVARRYAELADGPWPAERILEKMPMNYLYLGAIHRALPEASLIELVRSPLDSCFAMYRTLFGEAYPFSYDFEELARYYAAYSRLMQHWRALLGEHLQQVVYERLVQAPQREGAALAAHCGLAWSEAAVEIQNNAAVSLTASAAQVRRPIYGSSSGRWRHYRAHLEPLIEALERHGVALPADL